ncbi:MAG: L-lysine exporter family protein LysE/ArgO [Sulfurimonas sp.]
MISAIAIKGFSVTLSLIVAIGAQNAFVLKQGLKKEFVFSVVALCVFFDILLISSGVFGVGYLVETNPFFIKITAILGIIFLVSYGLLSVKSAIKGGHLEVNKSTSKSLKTTIFQLSLLTLLNPHVYLDAFVLIGGIGGSYSGYEDKLIFIFGCILASTFWFVLLGYGSRTLVGIFQKNITWKILDSIIAIVMFSIAYSLLDLL